MPERMSRSGAELRRRENQSKVIQDRMTNIEQHLGQLCDVSSSYTRKTARLRDKGDLLAKQLMEFSEYEKWNPTLSKGMAKCAENLSAVQDYREVEVKRLESKVVSPLVNYGLLCKQTKNDLRSAFAATDREVNQKKRLEALKTKNPTDRQKISQLESELQRTSLDASRSSKALEQQIDSFESKKLKDLKKIMREFVTVEMHFHAKALEMYTQCFQSLDSIDPDADLEEFRHQLRPDGSVRSDMARSASQASLESQSRQNSAQSTPRKSKINAQEVTPSSANVRRKIPVPPLAVNNINDDSEEDDDDDDDDDDDEYDSEDDYTETVTEKSGRRR